MTVEADPVHVESWLAAGGIACPTCGDGVLGGWGYARVRQVEGLSDPVRPRRARCRACTVTHVLLPVTVLLRRAYSAERVCRQPRACGGSSRPQLLPIKPSGPFRHGDAMQQCHSTGSRRGRGKSGWSHYTERGLRSVRVWSGWRMTEPRITQMTEPW